MSPAVSRGGLRNKEIARELGIEETTVKMHRQNALIKLDARSSAELVRIFTILDYETGDDPGARPPYETPEPSRCPLRDPVRGTGAFVHRGTGGRVGVGCLRDRSGARRDYRRDRGRKPPGAANVCVLEKESLLEGHSTISTGYFSAVRHMPGHDAEYRSAVDSMIADMEKTGKGLGNPELIRILVENSGAAYDWMTSLGVTWLPDPYEALGGLVPRSYLTSFVNGGYDYIFAVNRRAA